MSRAIYTSAGGICGDDLLVANRLPHEIAGSSASIEEVWREGDSAEREALGTNFFEDKAHGIERQWFSFVAGQTPEQLPDGWDPCRRNIAVFTTSEFEHAAIGPEYASRFYKDQSDGLARILASLARIDAPVYLNIRIHPNMKGIRNANLEQMLALRSPKAIVIPPESTVSSYGLLRACEKVLTFGSTMGIEAVYWGKPSILAGPATYQNLGGTYNPNNHEELLELLLADLPPRPKEAALKYGFHELRKGIEHVYYHPETPFRGKFKGLEIDNAISWFWRFIVRLAATHGCAGWAQLLA